MGHRASLELIPYTKAIPADQILLKLALDRHKNIRNSLGSHNCSNRDRSLHDTIIQDDKGKRVMAHNINYKLRSLAWNGPGGKIPS